MITEAELADRIHHWINEYGPGGYPHERSTNFLQLLIEHQGFVPAACGFVGVKLGTIADEVEDAIRSMTETPGLPGDENVCYKAAMVLRAYYLTPKHWPEDDRMRSLKLIGLPMSRDSYYRYVRLGRAFLLGFLCANDKKQLRGHMKANIV